MKTARRFLMLVAVAATVAVATAGAKLVSLSSGPRLPGLDCPSLVELGERDFGEIATGRFRVRNTGRADLRLTEFRTSCSCAGVEVEEGGQSRRVLQVTIPPGSSAELSVRVAVGARPGTPQQVVVQFETNDPTRPVGTVDVVVPRVKGGAYADPGAVVFGAVPRGGEARRVVRLYDNGVSNRRVEQVRSTHPDQFEARLLPADEGKESDIHETAGRLFARIEVVARSEQAGRLEGDIEVRLAGEQRAPVQIPVTGEITSAVACSPSALVLPRTVGGQRVSSGAVLVSGREGEPLRIEVLSVPAGFSATVQPVPGRPDRQSLRVERGAGVSAPVRESPLRLRAQSGSGPSELLEVTLTFLEGGP